MALNGGTTGMIGDPSGKSAERYLLNDETLRHYQACSKKQLAKFLDFESEVPNRAGGRALRLARAGSSPCARRRARSPRLSAISGSR